MPHPATRRGREHDLYRGNCPALSLIDYDTKGMTTEVGARLEELDGFSGALATVCPGSAAAGHIQRLSTSANCRNALTGEPCPSHGQHLYQLIADGADAKRFLYTLHDRAWLAGLGWYIVGVSGQLLERSIVDRMVCAPERLVFEAAADLTQSAVPLKQGRREAVVHDGPPLDTVAECLDLTAAEKSELTRRKAEAMQALGKECEIARKAFIKERTEAAIAKGMPRAKAEAMAAGWSNGTLRPGVVLHFDDPALGEIDVAEILADPNKFNDEACADPIEGVSYGTATAKVFLRADGSLFIKSFAHGGLFYKLVHDYDSIEAAIRKVDKKEAARVFCRLVLTADLDAVEVEALTKLAAARAGAGVRAVRKMLKDARPKHKARHTKTDIVVMEGIEKRVTYWTSLNERFAVTSTAASSLPAKKWRPIPIIYIADSASCQKPGSVKKSLAISRRSSALTMTRLMRQCSTCWPGRFKISGILPALSLCSTIQTSKQEREFSSRKLCSKSMARAAFRPPQ